MAFWTQRSVLVTGCTGFLGYWLTEALLRRKARVVGYIRDSVPYSPFFLEGLENQVTSVHGSVEDAPTLQRAIHEYEIDTVFHLAAQAIVGVANRSPVGTFEANIRGTWTVLEACRSSPLVTRVVVASSDKAYGDHDQLPYTEDFALQGRHPYDVSKSCADLISAAYFHTYGTPVCITRCGNLFGPGDLNFSRIVPGTIRSVIMGDAPIIRSDGSPIRDYVHVHDIREGYLLLAESMEDKSLHGRAFNFGTGEPKSVLDLTRLILRAAGRADLQPRILNEAKGEIRHQYLSSQLAHSRLGWKPGAPVAERLEQTFRWYRDYLARLADMGR